MIFRFILKLIGERRVWVWHLIFQFSFFRSFLAWYAVVMSEGDTGCITMPQLNAPVFGILTYDFTFGFLWL